MNEQVKAQEVFSGFKEKESFYIKVLSTLQEQYNHDLSALPAKDKKDLEKIYSQRWKNITEKIDKKEIYGNPDVQDYLNDILDVLIRANPELKNQSFHCYFSRSGIPNAAYLGEGLILFNMGLFTRLENESQVAFVLCHELAHFLLKHSENSIKKYVFTLNAPETQKELRNIKNMPYGKRQELEKLVKGITFDTRRHGRNHESSADSMAIELLKTTSFDLSESLSALALLDVIDQDTMNMKLALTQLFDQPEYPFQKRWLKKEEGLLGGHSELSADESIADSLKTHPDCNERIEALKPLIEKYTQSDVRKNLINAERFNQYQKLFNLEIVDYAFNSDNYSNCLYYAVKLLYEKADDPYLIAQTGKIFLGFYRAQDKHILGKVTDQPSPYFNSQQNMLLQFIQNLFKDDYAAIGYYFLKKNQAEGEQYPSFRKIFNDLNQINKQ